MVNVWRVLFLLSIIISCSAQNDGKQCNSSDTIITILFDDIVLTIWENDDPKCISYDQQINLRSSSSSRTIIYLSREKVRRLWHTIKWLFALPLICLPIIHITMVRVRICVAYLIRKVIAKETSCSSHYCLFVCLFVCLYVVVVVFTREQIDNWS